MKTGIVVLGHGSRACVGEANQVVFQISEMIKDRVGHDAVETAIMNRDSGLQNIDEAVRKLVDRGATRITIVPMFLANGVHIQQDIPDEVSQLRQEFPKVAIDMARHIGPDPRIADILIERIREVQ